jgi:ABC-2 type transport system ATP-binding protein
MKQRLAIATALLHRPALLILDEPTNGLDPSGIVEMRQLLSRLNAAEGVTVLVSSHLLSEIEKLVTHLGIINRGRMVFQGTTHDLRRRQRQLESVRIGTTDDARALAIVSAKIASVRMSERGIVLPPVGRDELAQVNRRLVESGVDVHEIRPETMDLETIFMGLVGADAA